MKKLDSIINKCKQSRFLRMSKIITTSATFALFLSIAFFVYETWDSKNEQKEVIGNLLQIQNSLTTKYLGLFPEYISGINELFEEGLETYTHNSLHKVDTIVIFEDVLYYGIKSRPEGFRKMNELIYQLAKNGCQVYIAYYDARGKAFQQMVRESLIATPLLPYYTQDQDLIFRDQTITNKIEIVSIKCEEYYQLTRLQDKHKHNRGIREYMRHIPIDREAKIGSAAYYANDLAQKMDSIKRNTIGKGKPENVTYAEYKRMYEEFTHQMEKFYSSCGDNVHLISLDNYLTMSCWMISGGGKSKAIFAFPSKYATDEIGFISQDEAIARYIRTMLNGVQIASIK